MALRAKKPEAVNKRLKMFLYGKAGTGKSTAAIQFPNAYIIDTERGTENYSDLIEAAGSVVYQTTNMEEVIEEIRNLIQQPHDFRTLVIDPRTILYDDLLHRCENKVGSDHGRHYGEAKKVMKRFDAMVLQLDMNMIITAHAKVEYGPNLQKLGYTFDDYKSSDYFFDLVLQLEKRGKDRYAKVEKTRIKAFPDGDSFVWSYKTFLDRYGAELIERKANTVALADTEQVDAIKTLIGKANVPALTVEKWLTQKGVDRFEDMRSEDIAKCISHIEKLLGKDAA